MPNRLQDQMVSFAPEDGFIAVQLEPPRDPNGLVTPVPKDRTVRCSSMSLPPALA